MYRSLLFFPPPSRPPARQTGGYNRILPARPYHYAWHFSLLGYSVIRNIVLTLGLWATWRLGALSGERCFFHFFNIVNHLLSPFWCQLTWWFHRISAIVIETIPRRRMVFIIWIDIAFLWETLPNSSISLLRRVLTAFCAACSVNGRHLLGVSCPMALAECHRHDGSKLAMLAILERVYYRVFVCAEP